MFDAVKPGPVAWADDLFHGFGWRGGFGIIFDDLVAAFCTLLVIAHGGSGEQATHDQLARRLLDRGWMLATAESCTGGMIAAACTDLAGSSNWFERGFVTYSDEAKIELLGVDAALIARARRRERSGGARHGVRRRAPFAAHGQRGGDRHRRARPAAARRSRWAPCGSASWWTDG